MKRELRKLVTRIEKEEKKYEKEKIKKLKAKWLRMNRKALWQRKYGKKHKRTRTDLFNYKTWLLAKGGVK